MTSTASRFRVVAAPTMAPGECRICQSVSRGPFIDTGVSDPWNGNVTYICMGCMNDMAGDIGYTLVDSEVAEPEPETDSEAFRRGWHAATTSILEDIRGLADHHAMHSSPEPVDPGGLVTDESQGLSADPQGQEGSGVSADRIVIQDGSTPKRKRSFSVSDDSGDGDEPES